jgi:hypothetical protein
MNTDTIQSLNSDGVRIVPEVGIDGVLRVVMSGAVEMRDPGQLLNPFWLSLDQAARERSLKLVELDVRDLSFMNSSGILTLVRWITTMKKNDPAQAYQLIVRYDRSITWQRSSVPTLSKLAPRLVIPSDINGN